MDRPENPLVQTLDSDKNSPKIAHPSHPPLYPSHGQSILSLQPQQPPRRLRRPPETISGLSEWPYDVPFMYRLLMSGDPQPCASLVSDGMEDEEPGSKTRLYAISGVFEPGYARVRRFADIVRAAVAQAPAPAPGSTAAASASGASQPASFMDRVKQMFSPQADAARTPVPASSAAPASDQLLAALDETLAFLDAHRDSHLLLETIELDIMSHAGEAALKACVDAEIARCRHAGAALDALPANVDEAARALRTAVPNPPRNRWTPSTDCAWTTISTARARAPLSVRWACRATCCISSCSTAASSKRICNRAEPRGPARRPRTACLFARAPARAMPANPARVNRAGFVTHLQSVTMPAACSGRHVAHR